MITFFPEARKVSESQDFSKWRIGDETHFKYQTLLNASFTIVLNFFHFIGTKSLYLVKPQQTNYFVSISATQRPDWSRTDQSEARVGSYCLSQQLRPASSLHCRLGRDWDSVGLLAGGGGRGCSWRLLTSLLTQHTTCTHCKHKHNKLDSHLCQAQ